MSTARRPRDKAASIRQRLLNLAQARGEPFEPFLDRYALERLLYRLSVSDMNKDFMPSRPVLQCPGGRTVRGA